MRLDPRFKFADVYAEVEYVFRSLMWNLARQHRYRCGDFSEVEHMNQFYQLMVPN